jgi:hypothetical protein
MRSRTRTRAEDRLQRQGSALTRSSIIALMAVGSISLWVLNPLLWLWITARLQSGSLSPTMGPYALMLIGIVLTCVVLAKGLTRLNRLYARVTGTDATIRVIRPWRRSLRGGRSLKRETDGTVPVSVLDVVMVISVALALLAFGTWFIATNPTPPGAGGPGPAKH